MSRARRAQFVGIDIGGANLKYAALDGVAHSRHFALWKKADALADVLQEDLSERFSHCKHLAVTMTGELADCFVDRAAGVRTICQHVDLAAARLHVNDVQVYGVDGRFRSVEQAMERVDLVAAANWHALAYWLARQSTGCATLIDIGSTTTDIIPLADGRVATAAQTDHERLLEGSLVYLGCRRTPVCAIVDRLQVGHRDCPLMNEWFATIDDARLLLGHQRPRPQDLDTADGRPRTTEFAAARLARMVGLDRRTVSLAQARQLAAQIHAAAQSKIRLALTRQAVPDAKWILSGHGDDLLEIADQTLVQRLAEDWGTELARSAPSYAVANLLAAELG